MKIENQENAKKILLWNNYYRVSGYAIHFEIFKDRRKTHKFKKEASFNKVIDLLQFDSQLRQLILRHIEILEIAFRSRFCYEMAMNTGDSHWHLDTTLFTSSDRWQHSEFIRICEQEAKRSHEIFIKSYQDKYSNPPEPASWIMTEIVSFGRWSKLYSNLKERGHKKLISNAFDVSPREMESWIHGLSLVRNLCAHHSRIWNRNFTTSLEIRSSFNRNISQNQTRRLLIYILVLNHLLRNVNKASSILSEFELLLGQYPWIPLNKMGIPEDYKEQDLWNRS